MRKFLMVCVVLSFACPLSGQDKGCGTVLSKKQEGVLRHFHHTEQAKSARISAEAVRNVAITAHLIRRNDGTGGLTAQQLADAITVLNDYYIHAGKHQLPKQQRKN